MVQGLHIFNLPLFATPFSHERRPHVRSGYDYPFLHAVSHFPVPFCVVLLFPPFSPPTSPSIIVSNLYRFIT